MLANIVDLDLVCEISLVGLRCVMGRCTLCTTRGRHELYTCLMVLPSHACTTYIDIQIVIFTILIFTVHMSLNVTSQCVIPYCSPILVEGNTIRFRIVEPGGR